MKATFLIVLLTSAICTYNYPQHPDSHKQHHDQKHNDFRYDRTDAFKYRDENAIYKMKLGDKGMPINTYNGQRPNEKQVGVIKNTLTNDFLVNDDTTGLTWQFSPAIAIDSVGNFAIAWMDLQNANWDIYFQRYNLNGVPQGINNKVNDDTGTTIQSFPSIAMDGGGNFVIAWGDERNGNYDIYYQLYNSGGIATGVNAKANESGGSGYYPGIAMDVAGNFVIAWGDERNGNYDIYYQLYNSGGIATGVNTKANESGGSGYNPGIAMDVAGNFVIAWEDSRNGIYDIYFQRYNSSGIAQGVNTKANDDAGNSSQRYPSITLNALGNFVIAWEDYRNGNADIYYQRYNNSGIAQGINAKANDDAGNSSQRYPSIALNTLGNFVIAWDDYRNGNYDIYFQHYNSSGIAQGVNIKANDDAVALSQNSPTIAMDVAGNFVIAFDKYSDIYYQRYNSNGIPQGINTKANNDVGTTSQWYPSIAMNAVGNFVIVWKDKRNGNSDIYYQRYNNSGVAQGINTKVNESSGGGDYPVIAMDGGGNFVIVWNDFRNFEWNIYYQRYNSGGIPQGVNIQVNEVNGTAFQGYPTIATDGGGNFVIAWGDERNGNYDIYYQQYNNSGITQGVNTKANDDSGTTVQGDPSIAKDIGGNFVIAWNDGRNSNYDIYYQRYNNSGITQGVNLKANDDGGTSDQWSTSIAMDDAGNFVIVWEDSRNGNADIYYQRYNNSGIAQGINAKANDDAGNSSQRYPSIALNALGNFVIVWQDYRYGSNNPDVIGQRFYSNGSFNSGNYRIVADGPNHREISPVVAANINKTIFSWMDNRRSKGWDIYAKIVGWDWNGVTSITQENNLPVEFSLSQNYPNSFNPSTKIKYALSSTQYATLKVYDVLGNEVATLVDEFKPAGSYEIEFQSSVGSQQLASGIYFYQLRAGDPESSSGQGFVETKKMILLR